MNRIVIIEETVVSVTGEPSGMTGAVDVELNPATADVPYPP
jgi:hypothetical protein